MRLILPHSSLEGGKLPVTVQRGWRVICKKRSLLIVLGSLSPTRDGAPFMELVHMAKLIVESIGEQLLSQATENGLFRMGSA